MLTLLVPWQAAGLEEALAVEVLLQCVPQDGQAAGNRRVSCALLDAAIRALRQVCACWCCLAPSRLLDQKKPWGLQSSLRVSHRMDKLQT